MSTSIAIRTLRRSLRTHGILGTLRLIPSKFRPRVLEPDPFDLQYGVQTAGSIAIEALSIAEADAWAAEEAVRYQPAAIDTFDQLMRQVRIPDGATFLDIGSGMGRCLLLASRYPFAEILGVEFGLELHAIARRNLLQFSAPWQVCRRLRSVRANAITYELPLTPLVLFLFNPFGRGMVREFRMHVERSMRAHPRPILLIYQHPIGADVFEESLSWRVVHRQVEGIVYQVR